MFMFTQLEFAIVFDMAIIIAATTGYGASLFFTPRCHVDSFMPLSTFSPLACHAIFLPAEVMFSRVFR